MCIPSETTIFYSWWPFFFFQLSKSFLKAEPISWIMSDVVVDLPCLWKAWLLHCLVREQAPHAATTDGFTLGGDKNEKWGNTYKHKYQTYICIMLHFLNFSAFTLIWSNLSNLVSLLNSSPKNVRVDWFVFLSEKWQMIRWTNVLIGLSLPQ